MALLLQPAFYLGQYLAQAWLVCRGQSVCRPNVFVVRMSDDFRMMWSIVISEYALLISDIGIGVMHADRITKLGTDNLIEIEVGTVPENNTTADQSIIII